MTALLLPVVGLDWYPGMPGVRTSIRAPIPHRLALRTAVVGDCWEYQWTRDEDGYGHIRYGGRPSGRAHVAAWEWANQQTVPSGMVVRHTCDNPPCCRPLHLLIGTSQDNVDDRQERGRMCRGTAHHEGKLTEERVRGIRAAYAAGASYDDMSAAFGVSRSMVWKVVTGRSWAWVA